MAQKWSATPRGESRRSGVALSWMLILTAGGAMPAQATDANQPAPACTGAFPAPTVPMILSRQVRRDLHDGKEIVVTRRYRVTFVATPDGFVINGDLLGTDVDAPARLAGLAAIEQQRPDTTTFPMPLDPTGLIIARRAGVSAGLPQSVQAITGHLIAGAGLIALEQEQVDDFVARLFSMQGPIVSQWPEALFRPNGMPTVTRDILPLPDKREGKVTISLKPQSAHSCALMQRMKRTIETQVDGVNRRTQEIWTLAPMP